MSVTDTKVGDILSTIVKGMGAVPGIWPKSMTGAPLTMATGAGLGAGIGGLLVAPAISKTLSAVTGQQFDRKKLRRNLAIIGAGLGMVPGAYLGIARHKLEGGFAGPLTLDKQGQANPFADPTGLGAYRFEPRFPVATSAREIYADPFMDPLTKIMSMNLVNEAGRDAGVGRTGLASPSDLMSALPRVAGDAIPTMGGAWLVSKLLGAPRPVLRTAVGGAALYSALHGFLNRG